MNPLFVGVDIGGTKTAVVLSNRLPHVTFRTEFQTEPANGSDHALSRIISSIRDAVASNATGGKLHSIGVSCGGPLDRQRGVIQEPPNLPTWVDVPIKAILEEEFNVPCYLENDANAGAIAELCFGAGQGCRNLVFLTMGTGLGAGLIVNGELLRGASETAGEIGHVRLSEHGPNGYGKHGSVEGWASGAGLARRARAAVLAAEEAGEPTTLMAKQHSLTAKDVAEAAEEGDPLARRILEETGVRLGEAIAILVDLLNPECVVVGGLAVRLGDRLLDPAKRRLKEEALAPNVRVCRVLPAALQDRVGDIAALCVASRLGAPDNHRR